MFKLYFKFASKQCELNTCHSVPKTDALPLRYISSKFLIVFFEESKI